MYHFSGAQVGLGIKKVQISRLERGYSISLPTMSRVFRALGVASATIDLGPAVGKVTLWKQMYASEQAATQLSLN